MYRIAIVEDQAGDANRLSSLLKQYAEAKHLLLSITWEQNASDFLDRYQHQYDLIFLDVRMPGIDGMQVAHELRETDHTVTLVFLTSLAQYAVESYEVEAADYILKPITTAALELKLPRILAHCKTESDEFVIQSGGSIIKLSANELLYVEIFDHHIQFVTTNGVIRSYGTLKEVETALPKCFFRMNNQTIVNLRFVTRVDGDNAMIAGRMFSISRGRRKGFMSSLHVSGMCI